MPDPILAYIVPLQTGGTPEHPIAGPPPGIWPSPGHPAHPISPGGGPSQGPGFPTFPIVIPPGFPVSPSHPIVIPSPPMPPVGIWPSPGRPEHPISPGGGPSHPIVVPPDVDVWPPNAKPEHPIIVPPPTTIWPPLPVHPIILPDPPTDGSPPKPPEIMERWDVIAYWTPTGGWAMAIVPSKSHPGTPTPSAAPRP
jgi:hypothetical protein